MDRISAIFYIPMAVHHVQNLAGYLLSGHIYGFSNQLLLNIWSIGTYLLNNRVCHNRPNCRPVAGSPLGTLEDCLNADINGCNAFIGNTVHPAVHWIFPSPIHLAKILTHPQTGNTKVLTGNIFIVLVQLQ